MLIDLYSGSYTYIYDMKSSIWLIALLITVNIAGAQRSINMKKPPVTKKGNTKDNYHGNRIADPYRWLEDDNARDTKKWVDQQNEYTQEYLAQIPFRERIKDDLTNLWNYEKYSSPFKKGNYYFFFKNNGLQNQSVLYYQEGLNGDPVVFLDPNKLNASGTAALGGLSFSKNNQYCAYSVAQAGSDWQDIYIMEVASRKVLEDKISYTKFSNAAWLGEEGFYYSGYDKPKREKDKFSAKTEFQKIFYHQLGTSQSQDKLVYEDKNNPLRYKGIDISTDQQYLILSESEGTDGSQISYRNISDNMGDFKVLLKGFTKNYHVIDVVNGKFYVHTNDGKGNASNYQVVAITPGQSNSGSWETIIAPKSEKLESVRLVGGKFICEYLKDARSQVMQYDMSGKWEGEVALPGLGSVSGFGGDIKDDHTFYTFSSFNAPPTIYKYDIASQKSTLFKKASLPMSTDNIEIEQRFFPSKDGNMIPMFIVHRSDIELGGNPKPVLMYGYGGFNISLGPGFSIPNMYFVQQGGIYVMVNLRGGGEYGEDWHKQGMLSQKQNVFDDFISAGEYLIENEITSPSKLAISGRSNGGLLVGACMTQRPDLFKVALPGVGVLDMLRYHKFTVGWGWVVEYGSSDNEKDFNYLIKYSPLHNLKKDVNYPATMVTTADHDDRVVPAHSFKFAATLQEMNSNKNPALIRIDKQAGHGAGKPTSKVIEEYTDVLSFVMYHLGMSVEP